MNKLSVALVLFILFVSSCNQKPNPVVNWPPMLEYDDTYGCIDAGTHIKD